MQGVWEDYPAYMTAASGRRSAHLEAMISGRAVGLTLEAIISKTIGFVKKKHYSASKPHHSRVVLSTG